MNLITQVPQSVRPFDSSMQYGVENIRFMCLWHIFYRQIMECARIYQVLYTVVGDSAHSSSPPTAENLVLDMYHGEFLTSDQERIVLHFTQDSALPCVLATRAFSLGEQIKDVRHIIHWVPPQTTWITGSRLQGRHVPLPGMPCQEWSERGTCWPCVVHHPVYAGKTSIIYMWKWSSNGRTYPLHRMRLVCIVGFFITI